MTVGADQGRLLAAISQLCAELGDGESRPSEQCAGAQAPGLAAIAFEGMLDSRDARLVDAIRGELALLAATALGSGPQPAAVSDAVQVAQDGAELVMRRELSEGNPEKLADFLPSFVYLIVLAPRGEERAQELSLRAQELLGVGLD
jgi:hypothetical protein